MWEFLPLNSIKQWAVWPSATMRMRGHPRGNLHDVTGPMTSAERQTPQTQRQEDLVLLTNTLGKSKWNSSTERSATHFFLVWHNWRTWSKYVRCKAHLPHCWMWRGICMGVWNFKGHNFTQTCPQCKSVEHKNNQTTEEMSILTAQQLHFYLSEGDSDTRKGGGPNMIYKRIKTATCKLIKARLLKIFILVCYVEYVTSTWKTVMLEKLFSWKCTALMWCVTKYYNTGCF